MKKNALLVLNNLPELVALTIVLGTIFLLFTYTLSWAQPEYLLRWLPNALTNGIHLTVSDWFRGVDSVAFDGAVRPRFISYSLTVLNTKFRLWLYDFFVPFPNFSIAFIVSLIASPVLYFLFSKTLLGGKREAYFATGLHLTSVGFISSMSFQYHQGKTLIQPVVLLLFLLLARLHTEVEARYFGSAWTKAVLAVLLLNFIGIAVDETYAIMACAGVPFFYRLFWPRGWSGGDIWKSLKSLALYFLPFVVFAVCVAALPYALRKIPHTRELFLNNEYEFYFRSVLDTWTINAQSPSHGHILLNIYLSIVGTIKNYYSISSSLFEIRSAVPSLGEAEDPSLGRWTNLAVALLFVVPFLAIAWRCRPLASQKKAVVGNRILWGLPAAFVVYFVGSSMITQFHNGAPVVTGFFYGSLISILLPIVVVALLMRWRAMPQFVGKLGCLVLMAISASNGLLMTLGASGGHSAYNDKLVSGNSTDTYPMNFKATFPDVDFAFDRDEFHIWMPSRERATRATLYAYWYKWKEGDDIDFTRMGAWDIRDVWFLEEMYFLQKYRQPVSVEKRGS